MNKFTEPRKAERPEGVFKLTSTEKGIVFPLPVLPVPTAPNDNSVPDYMRGEDHSADTISSDVKMPRLMQAQGLSPQITGLNQEVEKIKLLEMGQFFNSMTGRIYGDSVTVVIANYGKSRFLKADGENQISSCFSPNSIDGGIHSATCAVCPHNKWDGSKAPQCNLSMNYMLLVADGDDVGDEVLLSLKSAKLAIGKIWNTKVKASAKPLYAFKYTLTKSIANGTDKDGKPAAYFSFTVAVNGFASENQYRTAKAVYAALNRNEVRYE
jgi:hypothetical protein